MKTPNEIAALVAAELAAIEDPKMKARIQELLVTPYPSERAWDYGLEGQKYLCWVILEHPKSNTAIAYCSEGFGPRCPWGLLFLAGDGPEMSMGMDSGWYPKLEWTFRESWAYEEAAPT